MIIPVFTYYSSAFLGWSESKKFKVRDIERRSIKIITDCAQDNLELRIPSIENSIKKRICKLVFDSLNGSGRICDIFMNYFEKMDHSYKTRNNKFSLKLPKVNTNIGRNSFFFKAAIIFNEIPLDIRLLSSRALFVRAVDVSFS